MTYRELLAQLQNLSDSQLDMDISVHCIHSDEYHPASFKITVESDVLDIDHPILTIDA